MKGNFFTACVSPLYYEDSVRESLLRYKFQRMTVYAKPYGELIARCVEEYIEGEVDIISWVPLSKKRLRLRGYDQAQLLAEVISKEIGIPCVVKPIMSSSGHGQSTIKKQDDIEKAWQIAQEGGRAGAGRVIVEGFVDFDYEITLLTVRNLAGTQYCEPIGHIQIDGDYRYSWQPQPMTSGALLKAQEIAKKVTDALGGYGIFGVEMFIKGDDVIFSEVSPRPHDTGMVTMISQDQSEFALHARALLGLPIPSIKFYGPSASRAIVVEGETNRIEFDNLEQVLAEPGVQMRIFGKPEINGHRRMGVILATDESVEAAREKAERAYQALTVNVLPRE